MNQLNKIDERQLSLSGSKLDTYLGIKLSVEGLLDLSRKANNPEPTFVGTNNGLTIPEPKKFSLLDNSQ